MSVVEHLLPIGQGKTRSWEQYLLDSALAVAGTMLVTGVIAVFQLYPRIPNISIVYLPSWGFGFGACCVQRIG